MAKRGVEDRVIKRKRLFQMRSGRRKPAGKQQVSSERVVGQNEPSGIIALAAQAQQILVQAQRQIEFTAAHVITRLPVGNLKEPHGRTQLLPQLSCAGVGLARFRRRVAFGRLQDRAQRTDKFKLLSLAFRGVWHQLQLVQPLLQLRGRFRHRRAGGGAVTGLAPVLDGFFSEPSFGVMLREKFGLALRQFREMGFKRFGNLRMQLLPGTSQQAAVRRVLNQRVLEGVDRVGRRAALEHQLGSDEVSESGLQLVFRETVRSSP
jgi:hypothetical protein